MGEDWVEFKVMACPILMTQVDWSCAGRELDLERHITVSSAKAEEFPADNLQHSDVNMDVEICEMVNAAGDWKAKWNADQPYYA